jgi:hypothetical protein
MVMLEDTIAIHAAFLFGLLFNLEDVGNRFYQNIR